MRRFFSRYMLAYDRFPYTVAFGTATAKAALADGFTQTQIEGDGDGEFDWSRFTAFAMWGGLYCGCAQHVIFTRVIPSLVPKTASAFAIKRMAIDQGIVTPLLFYPTYFTFKSVVYGGTLQQGLAELISDGPSIWARGLALWAPVSVINFSLVPKQLRVGFVASVSLLWLCVLSFLSPMSSPKDRDQDKEKEMSKVES